MARDVLSLEPFVRIDGCIFCYGCLCSSLTGWLEEAFGHLEKCSSHK